MFKIHSYKTLISVALVAILNGCADITDDTVPDKTQTDTLAPSVPLDLIALDVSATSVQIQWTVSTDNIAVTDYYVYRDSIQIGSLTNTTFIDDTLEANTLYEYSVAAADAALNVSNKSASLIITTPSRSDNASLPAVLVPAGYDCNDTTVHCVDDRSSVNQEFFTIQEAVNIASPGDTVVVHEGTYAGFSVSASGVSDDNRITITANGNNVLINSGGSTQGRVLVSNSNYITIEGFTIESAAGYCLAARDASANSPMLGVTFQFNTVRNCGSSNIYMSNASYSMILGNTSYGSQAGHGIYLSNAGSDHTLIKGNRSYSNASNGLYFNADMYSGADGLQSYITIEGNTVYDNGQSGVEADGLYDSVFVNNLLYGNARHAVRGFQIDSSGGVARLSFVNNTIANNGSWGVKLSQDLGGHVFFNNIIMSNASGCIASGHSALEVDKNIYDSSCRFSQDGESSTLSYTNWQASYSDSSITDSLSSVVVSAANNDYTLSGGSAAIDAGLSSFASISSPVKDIADNLRPVNAVDIGAFEK
ncbi:MAG: right-handed parallel beta-helix repeat-containing protein [Gammaproteobacteria bacterium]|nr:right-handed parallel beta-helix repeat-containing protein [Gammaproteobacteria bacterium]